VVQAANRPLVQQLGLPAELRGKPLAGLLRAGGLEALSRTLGELAGDASRTYDEVDVRVGERLYRMRVALHNLRDPSGEIFGSVIFVREISHEPLRRRLQDAVSRLADAEGPLRPELEKARGELRALADEARHLGIDSPGVGQLSEGLSRTLTAIENWLDVDGSLAGQDYPDAQLLQERMRVARARWPLPDRVPERVRQLARRVEDYYESGENPKQPVL
jgi:hypothetical protein